MPFRARALVGLLLLCGPAYPWGRDGHRIVALLAEPFVTPAARQAVQALLDSGESMASVSSWADEVRSTRRETGPWHYVSIPISRSVLDMEKLCAGEDCVVGQVLRWQRVLRDPQANRNEKRDALRFLIHFVGDMHQPLHCADNGDRGGNTVQVQYFGLTVNLHSLWDSGILRRMQPQGDAMAQELGNTLASRREEFSRGTVQEWALEAHWLAKETVYGRLPGGPRSGEVIALGEPYRVAAEPVVRLQLQRGGVRLAALLNGIFGEDASPSIQTVLQTQVDAWNRGDVRAFMQGYADTPDLTFVSTSGVTQGYQGVLDNYLRRYQTQAQMGQLAFSGLVVQPLGTQHANVLGRWQLTRTAKAGGVVGGVFTLLFERRPEGWRIIQDHTSQLAK